MKIKKELIILIILICGLLLYILQRKTDQVSYQLPDIPAVPKKEITKVSVTKNENSIVLTKKNEKWYIEPKKYLADSSKINEMLSGIEGLSLAALVSESKNYNRYDLDEQNKIIVKAWRDATLTREFSVGKTTSSARHTFVVLAEDDRVYQAMENLRGKFDYSVNNLRDKMVVSFEPSEIREIDFTKGDQLVTLIKTQKKLNDSSSTTAENGDPETPSDIVKSTWQSADGKNVNENSLNRLISDLSKYKCQRYIDDNPKDQFKEPVYAIVLKGTRDYSLSIFAMTAEDNEYYPAVSSENDYPFELSKWQVEELMKFPGDILLNPEGSVADEK